jgi:hypothetical protein
MHGALTFLRRKLRSASYSGLPCARVWLSATHPLAPSPDPADSDRRAGTDLAIRACVAFPTRGSSATGGQPAAGAVSERGEDCFCLAHFESARRFNAQMGDFPIVGDQGVALAAPPHAAGVQVQFQTERLCESRGAVG